MKRVIMFFLTFLLFVTGQQVMAIDCAEFQVYPGTNLCYHMQTIPWVAFGGRYQYNIKMLGNTKDVGGWVQIGFHVWSLDGKSQPVMFLTDNIIHIGEPKGVGSVAYNLLSGESRETNLLYTGVCDSDSVGNITCQPTPDVVVTGSIEIQYTSSDPAYLRNLPPVQTMLTLKDPEGVTIGTAVQKSSAPASAWIGPISETFDKAQNWKDALASSTAIANPGDTPVLVDATLYDERGTVLVDFQVQVPARGTVPIILAETLGDKLFPRGKDFTGTILFRVAPPSPLNPPGPGINVVVFQMNGTTWGNLDVSPVVMK